LLCSRDSPWTVPNELEVPTFAALAQARSDGEVRKGSTRCKRGRRGGFNHTRLCQSCGVTPFLAFAQMEQTLKTRESSAWRPESRNSAQLRSDLSAGLMQSGPRVRCTSSICASCSQAACLLEGVVQVCALSLDTVFLDHTLSSSCPFSCFLFLFSVSFS
jgi:hypothetical protein